MGPMLVLFTLFWLIPSTLSWDPPQIQLPTYTYQCMPMELRWSLGSPPYSIWFYDYGRAAGQPVPGLGAWHNITGYNYLVPCQAPAGASLGIALRDSTGWISIAGSFLVLPSSNSSCLTSATNDADLSASQGTLSTIMQKFQQSVISAISVSATATPTVQAITSIAIIPPSQSASSRSAEPIATATMEFGRSSNPLRIVIPVLGSLVVVVILIILGICLVRRRRRQPKKVKPRHPLASTSGVDLMDGESMHMMASIERNEEPVQPVQPVQPARDQGVPEPPTREVDPTGAGATGPPRQMRLHEAWPSTVKNRLSEVPPVPAESEPELRAGSSPTTTQNDTQPQIPPQPQTLEQRAEQLSAPELERLAALVARRLDRVRGAPPQYEATEGVGV